MYDYGAAGHDGTQTHTGFAGVQHTTTDYGSPRPPPGIPVASGADTIQNTAEATTRQPPPLALAINAAKENTANAGPTAMGGRPGDRAGAPSIMPPPSSDTTAAVSNNNTIKLVGQHGSVLLPSDCGDNKAEVKAICAESCA